MNEQSKAKRLIATIGRIAIAEERARRGAGPRTRNPPRTTVDWSGGGAKQLGSGGPGVIAEVSVSGNGILQDFYGSYETSIGDPSTANSFATVTERDKSVTLNHASGPVLGQSSFAADQFRYGKLKFGKPENAPGADI